ncbi:Cof-type HAD-IIB family hydrolase [Fictibacillus iocasae]|uniref:Cof-type HAD-IIB family hydrolase n=1 Tax=Fictibacillus iocasae TaxID=2715437 RepID=A0ABW2NLV2_9BACL
MKLIAIDMDGTLVNKQLKVTKENAQAIREAKNKGHLVVIATGRSYDEARFALSDAELHLPLICVNGAEIRSDDWEILTSVPIPHIQYEQIARTLNNEDIYYELYTNKGTYTANRERAYEVMKDIVLTSNPEATDDDVQKAALRRIKLGLVNVVSSYSELLQEEGVEVYKLLAFDGNHDKLTRAANHLTEMDELAVSSSSKNNLEITNAEAQKGVALEKFAQMHDICMKDTMAIGDNFNDVSMLERAGTPVAMGNAEEEVKKIAKYVTKSNEESGVAHAIRNFL